MSKHIVVDIDIVPGRLDTAVKAFRVLAARTLEEPGCLRFDVYVSEADADRIVLVEEWADQSAIDLHMEQDYTRDFIAWSTTLFANPARARAIAPVAV